MSNSIERLTRLLDIKIEREINTKAASKKALSTVNTDYKLAETDLTTKTGYQRVVYQYTLSGTTHIVEDSLLCVLGILTNEGTINNEGTLVVGGSLCP